MSDFRFAGRWLNDRRIMTLTGDDFKAFVTAGTWMVENRTDGFLTADDMEFIPRFTRASAARLVEAGLWIEHGNGWLMVEYQGTQTTRSEFEALENIRRTAREKKARQRAAGRSGADGPSFSPGDGPGDMSRGTTQDRTGQEGQARNNGGTREPVLTWATAPIPNSVTDYGCSVCGGLLPCDNSDDAAHVAARAA